MKKYLTKIIFLLILVCGSLFIAPSSAYAWDCPEDCSVSQCSNAKCAACSYCRDVSHCNFTKLKKDYLGGGTSMCWYCRIVSIMTNAYLSAVDIALRSAKTIGDLILKYGFLIWLGYYILQQVSSMAPTTPGKMLQEVAIMGFKVLLATVAVRKGIPVLTTYFLDPVMLTGVDYGLAMLSGLLPTD